MLVANFVKLLKQYGITYKNLKIETNNDKKRDLKKLFDQIEDRLVKESKLSPITLATLAGLLDRVVEKIEAKEADVNQDINMYKPILSMGISAFNEKYSKDSEITFDSIESGPSNLLILALTSEHYEIAHYLLGLKNISKENLNEALNQTVYLSRRIQRPDETYEQASKKTEKLEELVQILLEKGAKPDQYVGDEKFPLVVMAIIFGNPKIVGYFLQNGGGQGELHEDGARALNYAIISYKNDTAVLETIILNVDLSNEVYRCRKPAEKEFDALPMGPITYAIVKGRQNLHVPLVGCLLNGWKFQIAKNEKIQAKEKQSENGNTYRKEAMFYDVFCALFIASHYKYTFLFKPLLSGIEYALSLEQDSLVKQLDVPTFSGDNFFDNIVQYITKIKSEITRKVNSYLTDLNKNASQSEKRTEANENINQKKNIEDILIELSLNCVSCKKDLIKSGRKVYYIDNFRLKALNASLSKDIHGNKRIIDIDSSNFLETLASHLEGILPKNVTIEKEYKFEKNNAFSYPKVSQIKISNLNENNFDDKKIKIALQKKHILERILLDYDQDEEVVLSEKTKETKTTTVVDLELTEKEKREQEKEEKKVRHEENEKLREESKKPSDLESSASTITNSLTNATTSTSGVNKKKKNKKKKRKEESADQKLPENEIPVTNANEGLSFFSQKNTNYNSGNNNNSDDDDSYNNDSNNNNNNDDDSNNNSVNSFNPYKMDQRRNPLFTLNHPLQNTVPPISSFSFDPLRSIFSVLDNDVLLGQITAKHANFIKYFFRVAFFMFQIAKNARERNPNFLEKRIAQNAIVDLFQQIGERVRKALEVAPEEIPENVNNPEVVKELRNALRHLLAFHIEVSADLIEAGFIFSNDLFKKSALELNSSVRLLYRMTEAVNALACTDLFRKLQTEYNILLEKHHVNWYSLHALSINFEDFKPRLVQELRELTAFYNSMNSLVSDYPYTFIACKSKLGIITKLILSLEKSEEERIFELWSEKDQEEANKFITACKMTRGTFIYEKNSTVTEEIISKDLAAVILRLSKIAVSLTEKIVTENYEDVRSSNFAFEK